MVLPNVRETVASETAQGKTVEYDVPAPKLVSLRILPRTDAEVAQVDWLIGPCGQTRDSDMLEQANFQAIYEELDELDPNMLDHEILSWRHWACGWIEEMACRPGSACAKRQMEMKLQLDTYPVLNEDVLSTMEYEASINAEGKADMAEPAEVSEPEFPWDTTDVGGEA